MASYITHRRTDGEYQLLREHIEQVAEMAAQFAEPFGAQAHARRFLHEAGVMDGDALAGYEGKWLPYPVEYKRGQPKEHDADELQLCAQAIDGLPARAVGM